MLGSLRTHRLVQLQWQSLRRTSLAPHELTVRPTGAAAAGMAEFFAKSVSRHLLQSPPSSLPPLASGATAAAAASAAATGAASAAAAAAAAVGGPLTCQHSNNGGWTPL